MSVGIAAIKNMEQRVRAEHAYASAVARNLAFARNPEITDLVRLMDEQITAERTRNMQLREAVRTFNALPWHKRIFGKICVV